MHLDTDASASPGTSAGARGGGIKRKSAQACLHCKHQKLKCTGNIPCQRCENKSLQCEYEQASVPVGTEMLQERDCRISQLEITLSSIQQFVENHESILPTPSRTAVGNPYLVVPSPLLSGSGGSASFTGQLNNFNPYIISRCTDPVTAQIITEEQSYHLINLILPQIRTHGPMQLIPSLQELRANHKCFMSLCCAVAGQFVASTPASWLSLDLQSQHYMLAEAHLADSLSKANHSLFDILALMLASSYELKRGLCGQQRWLLLGHASQLATLLRLDRLPGTVAKAYMADNRYIPTSDQLWGWWLLICIHNHDCLISMTYRLPSTTKDLKYDHLQVEFFFRLTQKLRAVSPAFMSSASWHLTTETVAIFELSRIAKLYLCNTEADQEVQETWEATSQKLCSWINKLEEWSTTWLNPDYPRLHESVSGKLRIQILCHHYILCMTASALSPLFPDNINNVQSAATITYCRSRLQASAISVIDLAPGLLSADGSFLAPDCYATAIAHAAAILLRLTSLNLPLLSREQSAHYARTAIQFLEQSDHSILKLQTELASHIRKIAQLTGVGLDSSQAWMLPDTPMDMLDSHAWQPSATKSTQGVDGWDISLLKPLLYGAR